MKINKITLTGVDERTDIDRLISWPEFSAESGVVTSIAL